MLSGQRNLAGDFGGGEDGTPRGPGMKSCPVLLPYRVAAKPDAISGFAGWIVSEECALQCAVMVRRAVRAQKRCGALPLAVSNTDTARSTGVKHAQTRFRLTPALGAPCK